MLGMRGLGKVIFLNTMFLLDPTIINLSELCKSMNLDTPQSHHEWP